MVRKLAVTSFLFFFLTAPLARGGLITIHDQAFSPGTWTASILGGTNVSSVSLTQLVGQGVTGNALRTTVNGSGSYTFDVQQFKLDRPFETNVDGIIENISWDIWYKVENSSQFASWRLATRQGTTTYVSNSTYFEPQLFSPFWQRKTGSVAPSAFSRVTGPGGATIDTSASGAPIEFGYILSRGVFLSGSTQYRTSFFTLSIQTSAVPEPSSLFFVASALLGGLMYRRR